MSQCCVLTLLNTSTNHNRLRLWRCTEKHQTTKRRPRMTKTRPPRCDGVGVGHQFHLVLNGRSPGGRAAVCFCSPAPGVMSCEVEAKPQ